ncbi:MAG TPA: SDR family oxidoreductase [Sphingobium sp.]|uniref:SDR family NAD(P)-dependent oxidoreductase n=1 Tax=Sphingobium sp. TaxID=1912891 RepID=UPI002ECFB8C3
MGKRLAGKVALITGAAQGIGEACARVFAREGAIVVVSDIQTEKGETLAAELGGGALFQSLDVTDLAAWGTAVAAIIARCGDLDILVNNAGGGAGGGPIDRQQLDGHRRIMEVNVTGVWAGIKSVAPTMATKGGGSVVNISSIDGLAGVRDLSSYVASKHAVLGLTRSLALELGDKGIRVNSVHPGVIETPLVKSTSPASKARLEKALAMQPVKRMGKPEEVANAALFLASDESSYCTGTSLVVDGGHLAGPYRDPL